MVPSPGGAAGRVVQHGGGRVVQRLRAGAAALQDAAAAGLLRLRAAALHIQVRQCPVHLETE